MDSFGYRGNWGTLIPRVYAKSIPGAENGGHVIDVIKPLEHSPKTYQIATDRKQSGKFYISMAAVIGVIVFTGFARTFYLRGLFLTNR